MAVSSISHWIEKMKTGDEVAAQRLWEHYFEQLVRLCRKWLRGHPRRAADEEDVVLSAFDTFFKGIRAGKYPNLADRNNLWKLLVVIAARKASDYVKHEAREKRGGGRVVGEAGIGFEEILATEPSPEFAASVSEEYRRLLSKLGENRSRDIAELKLEGYTNKEIAQRLNCSLRTVERKLWYIRNKWSKEGSSDG
jgi:RNA polymerase sigma factor (sigma-70 family)